MPNTIPRASTGIPGLDEVLHGGLGIGHVFLLEGKPGSGKTTVGLQFLLEGARKGEKVFYVTLSETLEELTAVARSHRWSLDGITIYELETGAPTADQEYTVFSPDEVELTETTRRIFAEVERERPTRIVFDSLSELRMMARDPLRYRREILGLKHFFAGRKCTVLLLDDQTASDGDMQLHSISHGVVELLRVHHDYGASRRQLRVIKLRGSEFQDGFHDYVIKAGGLTVFPRLVAADHKARVDAQLISSGVAELDVLLGGGISLGTTTLIMGPAGVGKSTVAAQYANASARRGEKVVCFVFEENRDNYLARCERIGLDCALVEDGTVTIQQIDPAELSAGEFAYIVKEAVEVRNVRLIVLDSLNGYMSAMPSEQYLTLHLHELLTYLDQQGVATLMTLAQHGFLNTMQSPADISYLTDTVILLRYFEARGSIKQAISVLKNRGGAHERTLREFRLVESGFEIGEPLLDFQGVLTGTPVYLGDNARLLGR
jgi:circadian clock protein KaiC